MALFRKPKSKKNLRKHEPAADDENESDTVGTSYVALSFLYTTVIY